MIKQFLTLIFFVLVVFIAKSQSFSDESLVVIRIGNGEEILTSKSTPVFIDEFSLEGKLIRSIALPTSAQGKNRALTLSGNQMDEGYAGLSPNKDCLILVGYDTSLGIDSVLKTPSSKVPRTIALISEDGKINTENAITDAFGRVQVRSATIKDNQIWVTGGGYGIMTLQVGASKSDLVTTVTGRVLSIFNDQLYSVSIAPDIRMGQVGNGLPLSETDLNNMPGLPKDGSPWQFYFMDLNEEVKGLDVLYVADNIKGLCKYSLIDGVWVSNGSLGSGFFGLTAKKTNEGILLFATQSTSLSDTRLVSILDSSGYKGTLKGQVKVLVKGKSNTSFRGVTFSPTKSF